MPSRPKITKITGGCFAAVIPGSLASPKFKGYSDATRDVWGRELRLAESMLGALSIDALRPSVMQAFLDGIADRPGKQVAAFAVLKQLEKWAIVRDLLPLPIMMGVEVIGSDGGHEPWTDEHVELAERH